jgi:hypothetical protein
MTKTTTVSYDAIVDTLEEILGSLTILGDNDERILENQNEILEKLSNLSLPGGDYSIDME